MRTSSHHQPEAQHPKSPAIYTPVADYAIYVPIGQGQKRIARKPGHSYFQTRPVPKKKPRRICRSLHMPSKQRRLAEPPQQLFFSKLFDCHDAVDLFGSKRHFIAWFDGVEQKTILHLELGGSSCAS